MKYSVSAANEFIKNNVCTVNGKYRFRYHMMPPVGWMNDPNGLCVYRGEYHLFYQYYPYKAEWGAMHWGHFVSEDLITYRDEAVALAPENEKVISGCFSGGALVEGDELSLVYTRHFETGKTKEESVCVATSTDGVNFKTDYKPVFDNSSLPENFSREDFRDPYPVTVNGEVYIMVGGKDVKKKNGLIAVLKRGEGGVYRYAFSIGPYYELGVMAECPCYVRIGCKDVILVSGCKVKRKGNSYKNSNSSVFMVGKLDFEKGSFSVDYIREIDKGESFYAPQCITGQPDVIIGWFEMWDRPHPSSKHNWAGAFTIPRRLSIVNGKVRQEPIAALEKYYGKTYEYRGGVIPQVSDVRIKFDGPFRIAFNSSNGRFTVGSRKGNVYADTRRTRNGKGSVRKTDGCYNKGELRILFDKSGAELFVNNGEETISCRIYLDGDYTPVIKGSVQMEIKTIKTGG